MSEADEISIDEVRKLDLRAVKVTHCEKVEKSRSLLKILVDVDGNEKQIVSSISEYYEPSELVGKTIVIVNNLKKAKFMGLESQGMLLAVERDDLLSLLTTDREVPSGLRVS
ncbi:MAG: methionine--tRNA ligase subunit beta [Candidatus Thermoplasmatota archaeon]|jgi:methionine--tRNA ligase beta chain|nr:methionine--tRNA ligase subunit beta [Candidatus Thermoplasmatota archaeon]MCL5955713.1 methionine--tRNA ligase subunit beta [Candidatus Thermoplasmatota archaeon]